MLLLTDHKPLCGRFHCLNPTKSDRQQRLLALLTEFISDIEDVKGSQNIIADYLSRPTLAEAQTSDNEIQSFQDLKRFTIPRDNQFIFCDVSTSYPRPFVPSKLCESILIAPIPYQMIKARYYWLSVDKSIKEFCVSSKSLQAHKIAKISIEISLARFQTVHIDIVEPLLPAKSPINPYICPCREVLTCIDRTTRWIEVQPISDITAGNLAEVFINAWITL